MEPLLLVLIVVAVLIGGGALLLNRRGGGTSTLEPPMAPSAPTAVVPTVDAPPVAVEPETAPVAAPTKASLRDRLGKARSSLSGFMGSALSRSAIDRDTWDELEEALIRADVGVGTTTDILDRLRATVAAEGITESSVLLDALKNQLKADLAPGDRALHHEPGGPNVWLFVGVHGVGTTTTIG